MRLGWLIAGLALLAGGVAGAQSAALGLYNEANALYRQGEFQSARDRYLQVAEIGLQDARLYYNLGNACFKSGLLGQAILWYERALKLDPHDADARANLRFVNLVKKDRESAPEENVVWAFLVDVYLFPTLNELCLAFSFSLFLVFALAVWSLWNRGRARMLWLVLVLSCTSLTALTGGVLGLRVYRKETLVEAIALVEEGLARSAPDETRKVVFVIHEGTKVQIERREGDWLLIRLSNGLGGWLPAAAVAVI